MSFDCLLITFINLLTLFRLKNNLSVTSAPFLTNLWKVIQYLLSVKNEIALIPIRKGLFFVTKVKKVLQKILVQAGPEEIQAPSKHSKSVIVVAKQGTKYPLPQSPSIEAAVIAKKVSTFDSGTALKKDHAITEPPHTPCYKAAAKAKKLSKSGLSKLRSVCFAADDLEDGESQITLAPIELTEPIFPNTSVQDENKIIEPTILHPATPVRRSKRTNNVHESKDFAFGSKNSSALKNVDNFIKSSKETTSRFSFGIAGTDSGCLLSADLSSLTTAKDQFPEDPSTNLAKRKRNEDDSADNVMKSHSTDRNLVKKMKISKSIENYEYVAGFNATVF
jgi:hypothetical protein